MTLLGLVSLTAFATAECFVRARVVHRKSGKPCKQMLILVNSVGATNGDTTDNAGYCGINFSVSMSEYSRISFYAVRKAGDTVLLKSFLRFPKSFKIVSDQEYSTTFYLP